MSDEGKPEPGGPAEAPAGAPADLDEGTREALLERAKEARERAHAPYSNYAVGAAVLDAAGRIHAGCNVENAMYGATVCAERVAIWTAVAAGARRIRALALVTPNGGTPCGACRQVLREFAAEDTPVWVAGPTGPARGYTLGQLLPFAWTGDDLKDAVQARVRAHAR